MYCSQCGQELASESRFCHSCGTSVADTTVLDSVDLIRPSQERKQVTILFADLVDSTTLVQDLDPDELDEWFAGILSVMSRAVHRHGGTVNKSQGDGIMAVFGAPVAYEDHAIRACNAAWDLLQAKLSGETHDIKVRVGLHSGDVMLRTVQSDFSTTYEAIGYNVHLASRMESIAPEGGVVMTAVTEELSRGFVETEALGPTVIRGARDPMHVYRLTGLSREKSRWDVRASGGLSRFVGREREMSVLNNLLERAKHVSQTVCVSGGPGIGKSRLLHELLNLPVVSDWQVFRLSTVSHGSNITYLPISNFLRAWLQIEPSDSQTEIRAKLRAKNIDPNHDNGRLHVALSSLLDLPVDDPEWEEAGPPERHELVVKAIRAMVVAASVGQPTILVFEDLHWVDPGTLSAIKEIVENPPLSNLVIIATYRPEFEAEWADEENISQMPLTALEPADSREILRQSFAATASFAADLVDHMIERSGGTPFFLEEIIRAVREMKESGEVIQVSDLEGRLPSSIQSILAARIDRLSSEAKRAMQIASVIGREFQLSQVVKVAGTTIAVVGESIATLEARALIVPVESDSPGAYGFAHALTRDAAYQSLPLRDARALHSRMLEVLLRSNQTRQDEQVEEMAQHALRGESWGHATRLLERSAAKALARSANVEAGAFLEQAISALDHLPIQEQYLQKAIDLRLMLRVAYFPLGRVAEIGQRLSEAYDIADEIGDKKRLTLISLARLITFHITGDLVSANEDCNRALALAAELGDPNLLIGASLAAAQVRNFFGKPQDVIDLLLPFEDALLGEYRHVRIFGSIASSVNFLACIGTAYALIGNFDAGKNCSAKAVEIAGETGRGSDAALAHYVDGLLENHRGNTQAALQTLEQGMARCTSKDTQILHSWITVQMGLAYLTFGDYPAAVEILRQAKSVLDKMSIRTHGTTGRLYLANALAFNNEIGEAREIADEAWQRIQDFQIKILEPRALWLNGVLELLAKGRELNAPPAAFERGIEVSRDRSQAMDWADCLNGLSIYHGLHGNEAESDKLRAQAEAMSARHGGKVLEIPMHLIR